MNEKELSDRLSNMQHEEIELPEHRRRLKLALLNFAQKQEQPGWLKSRIISALTGFRNLLTAPRPVWQNALAVVAVVGVVGGNVGWIAVSGKIGSTGVCSCRDANPG